MSTIGKVEDKTSVLQLRIQPGLKTALRALAKKRGLSASELARRYIFAGMAAEIAAKAPQPVAGSAEPPGKGPAPSAKGASPERGQNENAAPYQLAWSRET